MPTDHLGNLEKKLSGDVTPENVQPMLVTSNEIVQVTAAELRALGDKHPDNEKCQDLVFGAQGFPDNHTLFVEKPDLEAAMTNSTVEVEEELQSAPDGSMVRVCKKKVVPLDSSPKKAKAKTPAKPASET